jgi:hypothetical protein
MNARIKLLAEQAYDELVEETGNIVVFDEDFQQRFAQLIVQECMDCSTWVGKVNKNVKEPGPMHTAHAINQRIKKHFGVEE